MVIRQSAHPSAIVGCDWLRFRAVAELAPFLLAYLRKRDAKISWVNGLHVQKVRTHQPIFLNFLC